MANITYDLLWKETMRDLLDTLELDPPEGIFQLCEAQKIVIRP